MSDRKIKTLQAIFGVWFVVAVQKWMGVKHLRWFDKGNRRVCYYCPCKEVS